MAKATASRPSTAREWECTQRACVNWEPVRRLRSLTCPPTRRKSKAGSCRQTNPELCSPSSAVTRSTRSPEGVCPSLPIAIHLSDKTHTNIVPVRCQRLCPSYSGYQQFQDSQDCYAGRGAALLRDSPA